MIDPLCVVVAASDDERAHHPDGDIPEFASLSSLEVPDSKREEAADPVSHRSGSPQCILHCHTISLLHSPIYLICLPTSLAGGRARGLAGWPTRQSPRRKLITRRCQQGLSQQKATTAANRRRSDSQLDGERATNHKVQLTHSQVR